MAYSLFYQLMPEDNSKDFILGLKIMPLPIAVKLHLNYNYGFTHS